MKKQILAVLIFGCFSLVVTAQNLKGIVVNELNQPLEAAYVYYQTTESHAHTSENGVFVINNTKVGDSIRIGLLVYRTIITKLDG